MAGFGTSQNPNDSPLCANNCGFFGNPKTRNLCSVCYTAFLKRPQDVDHSLKSHAAMNPSSSESDSKAPARKNRCRLCNKKVGLLGFSCRCGGLFCSIHRFQDKHGCSFDLKTVERERLAKQIIEIKGEKLQYRV